MTCFLSRCLFSVWLLLFSSVLVFAVPNPSALTFNYDGRVEASAAYDQTPPPGFDYGGVVALLAHESENTIGPRSSVFDKLGEFLAAKTRLPALYNVKFAAQQLLEDGQVSLNRLKLSDLPSDPHWPRSAYLKAARGSIPRIQQLAIGL